jgi:hypothetical protein
MLESSDYVPFQLLFVITVLASLVMTSKDLKVFVILVVIESLIGIAEYASNVTTFFPGETKAGVFNATYTLFYYKRVFGMCANSSSFAIKIFFAFLLVEFVPFDKKWKTISRLIFLLAIFCSFNRTIVIGLLFYLALSWNSDLIFYLKKIFKLKINTKLIIFLIISLVAFAFLIIFTVKYKTQIINQFTRSSGKLDLSNRQEIWKMHIDYFLSNPLFGNGSYKYYALFSKGDASHAHNSFIQLLSTNGLLITCLYLLILMIGISSQNYKLVLPILLIAFFQHILFWGISNEDIFLYMFLFNTRIYDAYSSIRGKPKYELEPKFSNN